MKLLLVSANMERNPYPVFPIGLAYLAPPLVSAGHTLSSLDLCFEEEPLLSLARELAANSPDAVIISIRNLDNVAWPATRSYLGWVKEVTDSCRGKSLAILGGSGFSLMPLEIMEHVGADYGIAGEGEEVLPLLLEYIESGKDPSQLPGLVSRGKSAFLPPKPVESPGIPDRSLFDLGRYCREGGMANLQTKRGCPFSCIYCTYPLLEGKLIRLRPIDEIISEMRKLTEECGVEYIYFVDDIFNYPPDFAEKLCRSMIAERINVNWSAFVNPGFVTSSLLELMKSAGCDAVEYGSDSGSAVMLEKMRKSFTVKNIIEGSKICHELNIEFAHYILFGGPGETEETVLATFSTMDEADPSAVIGMAGIRIYPGTEMEKTAIREGVVPAGGSLLHPLFYISPDIKENLCALVTSEALKRRTWIVPGLEINISDPMLEALRMFKVNGPLWKLMKRLGRSRVAPMSQQPGE